MKNITIISGVIVGVLTFYKPAYAQNEVQQLNQKINVLENRIQQLQAQVSENRAPVVVTPWFDYGWQWDPFVQMQEMRQQMDRIMSKVPVLPSGNVFNEVEKTDIQQTPAQYLITMEIPGVQKNKINVELRGRTLTISGGRSSETSPKKGKNVSKESSYGYFVQSVLLPEDAQLRSISSHYNKGVLTVSITREKGRNARDNFEKIIVK